VYVLNCETMEQWLPGSPYRKHKRLYSIKVPTHGMTYLEGILDKIFIVFTTANNK